MIFGGIFQNRSHHKTRINTEKNWIFFENSPCVALPRRLNTRESQDITNQNELELKLWQKHSPNRRSPPRSRTRPASAKSKLAKSSTTSLNWLTRMPRT